MRGIALFGILICTSPSLQASDPNLVDRLIKTELVNEKQLVDELNSILGTQSKPAKMFSLRNAFKPSVERNGARGNPNIFERHLPYDQNPTVCAIKFLDNLRITYQLQTFESKAQALERGYIITHTGPCGACSNLRDLAVYINIPDLTTPGRLCARKLNLLKSKACYQSILGLSDRCSEAWAYSTAHTRRHCFTTCAKDYGLIHLIRNILPKPDNNQNHHLRPCVQCDETVSGPGFKFMAGRTRRNSGLRSSIERDEREITPVDHSLYFKTTSP